MRILDLCAGMKAAGAAFFCALSEDMFKKDQHMVKAEPGFSDQAAVLCADIKFSLILQDLKISLLAQAGPVSALRA